MSNVDQPNQQLTVGTRLTPDQSISRFFADPANASGVASNIPLTGRDGLAMAMRCTSQPTVPGEECVRVPFSVKYYYAHAVELTDQRTGEVQSKVRLVFVNPEGETTSFASDGVLDSLDMIRRFLGDGPYDPPLKIKAVKVATRRGNTVTKLELVENAPLDQPPANSGRPRR